MQVFFKTREKARKATFGKLIDNGPTAELGKRFARQLNVVRKG